MKDAGELGGQAEDPKTELVSYFDALSLGPKPGTQTSRPQLPSKLLPPHGALVQQGEENKEVNLLLSVQSIEPGAPSTAPPRYRTESVRAFATETIQSLRLRLKNRGLFIRTPPLARILAGR